MYVSSVDFIKSPEHYLERVNAEPIHITRDGRDIAVLAKPSDTPITDSLIGILKDADVKSATDIKRIRFGI
jgi:hypothetical protein